MQIPCGLLVIAALLTSSVAQAQAPSAALDLRKALLHIQLHLGQSSVNLIGMSEGVSGEQKVAVLLISNACSEASEVIEGVDDLAQIFDAVTSQHDKDAVVVVMRDSAKHASRLFGSAIGIINYNLGYVQAPAIAAEATKMRDEIQRAADLIEQFARSPPAESK
jgi:hypothetical protein